MAKPQEIAKKYGCLGNANDGGNTIKVPYASGNTNYSRMLRSTFSLCCHYCHFYNQCHGFNVIISIFVDSSSCNSLVELVNQVKNRPIRNIRWTRDSVWTNLWIQTTSKVRKQYFRCHHLQSQFAFQFVFFGVFLDKLFILIH